MPDKKQSAQVDKPKVGRPRLFESPDVMFSIGEAWINERVSAGKPVTMSGLTRALGFECRASFDNYMKIPEYARTVKTLKLMVEESYECMLSEARNPAGAIFALKNFGWRDSVSVDHNGKLSLSLANAIDAGRRAVLEAKKDRGEIIEGSAEEADD